MSTFYDASDILSLENDVVTSGLGFRQRDKFLSSLISRSERVVVLALGSMIGTFAGPKGGCG